MAGGISVIGNNVRNAGNMPAISAGDSFPSIANKCQLFLYINDTNIYFWNGSSWVQTNSAAGVPPLKNVLTAGNSGEVDQQINLFAGDTDHQVTYTGNQIIFKNGSGLDIGSIKGTAISGLNSYLLPSCSGTFLVDNNFTRSNTATLVNGSLTIADPNITTSSVVIATRRSTNGSSSIGDISASRSPGVGFGFISYKTNGLIETNDNSIFFYIVYY